MIVFAVIGIVVAVAAAIYGIYRFFTPDYLDDFEDDFEDEFDMTSSRMRMMSRLQSLRMLPQTRQRTNHCRKRENFQAV